MPVRSRRALIAPNMKRRSMAYPRAGGFVHMPGNTGIPTPAFFIGPPGANADRFEGAETFTRASTSRAIDHSGTHVPLPVNAKVPFGARIVYNGLAANSSNDLSNAAWSLLATATVTGTNQVNLPAVNDGISQGVTLFGGAVNARFVASAYLEGTPGQTVSLIAARVGSGTYEETVQTVTLQAGRTRFAVSHTMQNASQTGCSLVVARRSGNTATVVNVYDAQLEVVVLNPDQSAVPGEYASTHQTHNLGVAGVRAFDTENGNTVDANGVVSPASGSGLSNVLWDVQPPTTNLATGACKIDGSGSDWLGHSNWTFEPAQSVVPGWPTYFVRSDGVGNRSIRQATGTYTGWRCFSLLVEQGDETAIEFGIGDQGGGNFNTGGLVRFRFDTEQFIYIAGASNKYFIEKLGIGPNGGKLYYLTIACDLSGATGTSLIHYIYANAQQAAATGCYLHGAQIENTAFPTVLIPTPSGSTASRTSRNWNYPYANNGNIAEGAVVINGLRVGFGTDQQSGSTGVFGSRNGAANWLYLNKSGVPSTQFAAHDGTTALGTNVSGNLAEYGDIFGAYSCWSATEALFFSRNKNQRGEFSGIGVAAFDGTMIGDLSTLYVAPAQPVQLPFRFKTLSLYSEFVHPFDLDKMI